MSVITISPTSFDINVLLRRFVMSVLPEDVDVIKGQDNRVPMPKGPDFIVFWPLRQERLETNTDRYIDLKFIGSIEGDVLTIEKVLIGGIQLCEIQEMERKLKWLIEKAHEVLRKIEHGYLRPDDEEYIRALPTIPKLRERKLFGVGLPPGIKIVKRHETIPDAYYLSKSVPGTEPPKSPEPDKPDKPHKSNKLHKLYRMIFRAHGWVPPHKPGAYADWDAGGQWDVGRPWDTVDEVDEPDEPDEPDKDRRIFSAGVVAVMQPMMVTYQLDIYGPRSEEHVAIISTLFRDPYGVSNYQGWPKQGSLVPLYTSDPHMLAFVNAEKQFERRWIIELMMQANMVVENVPQQFFDHIQLLTTDVDGGYAQNVIAVPPPAVPFELGPGAHVMKLQRLLDDLHRKIRYIYHGMLGVM